MADETGCEGRFVFVKIFNTSLPLQVAAPRLFDLMPLVLSAWEQMQTTEDRLRNAIFQKWNVSHLDPPATICRWACLRLKSLKFSNG